MDPGVQEFLARIESRAVHRTVQEHRQATLGEASVALRLRVIHWHRIAMKGEDMTALRPSVSLLLTALSCVACGGSQARESANIVTQPSNLSVAMCQAATFEVIAAGTPPITYQWLKDGQLVTGANQASFTISAPEPADAGSYSVRVSNHYGTITSVTASLQVTDPGPSVGPTVVANEAADSVAVGDDSIVWTSGGSGFVHATSATCPGAVRTLFNELYTCPFSVVVYAGDAYWADCDPGQAALYRAPLSAGDLQSVTVQGYEIGTLTNLGNELVWIVGGEGPQSVQTLALPAGTVATYPIQSPSPTSEPWAIAVDDQNYYWTEWVSGQPMEIDRMPLGGGSQTTVATDAGLISGFATDGQDIFFISSVGTRPDLTAFLRKVSVAGGPVQDLGSFAPADLGLVALDGPYVYWTVSPVSTPAGTVGTGYLSRVPKDGSEPSSVLVANLPFTGGLATDATYVYWTEFWLTGVGSVKRLRK